MRPHLIVDIRENTLFGLVVDGSGNVFPCSQTVSSERIRYFSSGILLEAGRFLEDGREEHRRKATDEMAEAFASVFPDGERLGWLRPWELKSNMAAIPLAHPLEVLSMPARKEIRADNRTVNQVAGGMLAFLLEPAIQFVNRQGLSPSEMNAVVLVPNSCGRRANLVLLKTLRRIGFRKAIILPSIVAAVLNGLESSQPVRAVAVDVKNQETSMQLVTLEVAEGRARVISDGARTVREMDWNNLVQIVAESIEESAHTGLADLLLKSYVERALLGLAGGVFATDIPSATPLKLTQNLVNDVLGGPRGATLLESAGNSLAELFAQTGWEADGVIPLGPACMLGNLEDAIAGKLKLPVPGPVQNRPALERAAYGVAGMLRWFEANPQATLEICPFHNIVIASRPGESSELVSARSFPKNPGERREFRLLLDVGRAEGIRAGMMPLILSCGDTHRRNACIVGAFGLDVSAEDFEAGRKLDVRFELSQRRTVSHMAGRVSFRLGEREVSGMLHFPEFRTRLKGADLE